MTLPIGTRLMTLDGTIFGNAIVISHVTVETNVSSGILYEIETDFGNRLHMKTMEEIDNYWSYDLEEEVDLRRWYDERYRLVHNNYQGGMVELVDAADLKFAG